MKETNWQFRLLLLALVLGVWGLFAQSLWRFFTSASRSAIPATRIYVCSSNEGKIFFDNSPGKIVFSGADLRNVLNEAAQKDIKVHSVIFAANGGAGNGYVVLVER